MTETNKVNPLAGTVMAIAQQFGIGTKPVADSGEPSAQDEPGRVHDEPGAAAGTALVPVSSAAERINAAHAEIVAAEAQRKTAQDQANALSREVRALDKSILQKHYEIGAMLIRQKEAVKHGEWGEWLKANCPHVPWRRANEYMELARFQRGILDFADSRQFGSAANLSVRGAHAIIAQLKPDKLKPEGPGGGQADEVDLPVASAVSSASSISAGQDWPLCSVTDPLVLEERERMIVELHDLIRGDGARARLTVHDLMEVLIEVWEPEQLEALHDILGCRIENRKAMLAPAEVEQVTAH
jgi:hypothetical protein